MTNNVELVRVEDVVLSGSDVSQLGLRRLQKARATGSIDLSFTARTDAGVKHLAGLLELWHFASACRVSNAIRPFTESIIA